MKSRGQDAPGRILGTMDFEAHAETMSMDGRSRGVMLPGLSDRERAQVLYVGVFPNLLIATTDPAYSLTIYNAAASPYGLRIGLVWFVIGISLVIAYTVIAHRAFWGKVGLHLIEGGH